MEELIREAEASRSLRNGRRSLGKGRLSLGNGRLSLGKGTHSLRETYGGVFHQV
jgi:hypothetical protein